VSTDSATTARRPPGFISRTMGDDRMNENDEDLVHCQHRIKISKNPGIQADFVIRHRHVSTLVSRLPAKDRVTTGSEGCLLPGNRMLSWTTACTRSEG
jgi:hypothetical protein